MKTYFAVLLLGLFCLGCSDSSSTSRPMSRVGQMLEGTHPIKAFSQPSTVVHGSIEGSYFLFAGELNGKLGTTTNVKFMWENNNQEYLIASLPVTKVRFKIDNSLTIPNVRFRWRHSNFADPDYSLSMDTIMQHNVIYALITCPEKDLPSQMEIQKIMN